MKNILFTILGLLLTGIVVAQSSQTIRGTVIDKDSRMAVPGVNIVLVNSNPLIGTVTDAEGVFRLEKVAIGRQSIQASSIGYKAISVNDLILNSVHEIVLVIEMEELVYQGAEVVVKADAIREETINQMAVVSARAFTVEETEKYAGSRGDVARMAMNFAGVSAANDQRNDIVIRGNSPSGLLWKLEDVDIPNPNHFAEGGTTGGPVSMLNNNLLSNSDFFTGAFPAEYGNALSGVFDLNMRNGNNEKHEFLFQVGFNGFEVGAEGPLSKNHKASYLANFRYSTLDLMSNIIDLGTTGIPEYKDLTFKLNFPVKKGIITVFGVAGDSKISILDSKSGNEQDLYSDEGQDLYNRSRMATGGLTYTRFVNQKTYMKFILSGVYQDGGTIIDTLNGLGEVHPWLDHNYTEFKTSVSGYSHTKYSSRFSTRAGLTIDRMGFDLTSSFFNKNDNAFRPAIDYSRSLKDGVTLYRPYVQATIRLNDNLSFFPGIHVMYYDLDKEFALEPRLGLNWQFTASQKLSLGYGRHSRTQSLSTYFLGTYLEDGSLIETNTELGMTHSDQLVLGYDLAINERTRLKAETYYQSLFDVPVEMRSSSFSMLNTGAGWGVGATDSLQNTGTGRNYGLEFTLERFFNKNFYYLTTVSLFESKYKGSDGVERNTVFNGNYVVNALFGREFKINDKSSFNIDLKATYAGGKRYTPILLADSQLEGKAVYDESKAYSEQFDPFFKTDIKFTYRLNMKKISQEWVFYIENVTNHENVLMQSYSRSKGEVTNVNQLGFFPMLQYRLHF